MAPAIDPLPLHPPDLPLRALDSQPQEPSDQTQEIINRAESLYAAGLKDYEAGDKAGAKDKFDQAVETLLGSGLDVQGDDRLRAEFDRLVDDISGVELAAVERGDILSAHKYEPPPIESFSGLTFPVDPRVKQQVQQEMRSVHSDLPLVSNDAVDGAIAYLQTHARHYVETVLQRLGTYQPLISEAMRQAGLPQDLIFLAAGESAFNPFALSRKGAKGIWQFMPGTAELYGLRINRWVDEREDPVKSTWAAARHLRDLYHTFGDWFLAMAAYDWNPAGVEHAVQRTGYADYWTLRKLHALPAETENYVPIFLAVALIAKDPKAYGFDVAPNPPLAFDQVTVGAPTDLRLIATLIDHPVDELIRLNPSLQRWSTPADDPNFVLNLPVGTKERFEQSIRAVPPDKRMWWRAYKVQAGDTLAAIAHKFHLSPASVAAVNQLSPSESLVEGAKLLLPYAPGNEWSLARVTPRGPLRRYRYQVRRGDTIEMVADHFDVTPYQIRRWNHLRSQRLVSGRTIVLYTRIPVGGHVNRRASGTRRYASYTRRAASGKVKGASASRSVRRRQRLPRRHARTRRLARVLVPAAL